MEKAYYRKQEAQGTYRWRCPCCGGRPGVHKRRRRSVRHASNIQLRNSLKGPVQ